MKPTVSRGPRYRNQAVFRSAERLLASQPPSTQRRRPPRWVIFLIGLLCGAGVVLWWRSGDSRLAPKPFADAAAPTRANAARHTPPNVSTSSALPPTPTTAVPTSAPARDAALAADAAGTHGAAHKTAPVRSATSTEATGGIVAPAGVRAFASELRLVGELRTTADNHKTVVAFLLHLQPGTNIAVGSVTFHNEPAARPVTLVGSWNLESILLRSESNASGSGYEIILNFPSTAAGAFDCTTSDARGVTGTGQLQIPPPRTGQ